VPVLGAGQPRLAPLGRVQLGVVPLQAPDRTLPAALRAAQQTHSGVETHRWLPREQGHDGADSGPESRVASLAVSGAVSRFGWSAPAGAAPYGGCSIACR